jgi:hypothetical protein
MNRPHPPAPLRPAQCIASPKRGEGGQDLAFKVPLPLWERDLGRGNDIRARGLISIIWLGQDIQGALWMVIRPDECSRNLGD